MRTWIEHCKNSSDSSCIVTRIDDGGKLLCLCADGTFRPNDGAKSPRIFSDHEEAQKALARATASVIRITRACWWQDLEALRTTIGMPEALVGCLKELVSSHINNVVPPDATPHLVRLAKMYLNDGVKISDSAGDMLYDVVVFVPDPDKTERLRTFFRLIPKCRGGSFKHLKDV
jgi:hypothetical protein